MICMNIVSSLILTTLSSLIIRINYGSNHHTQCFNVPPRAMKGVSAEEFVDEHLEDRTIDDVLDDDEEKQEGVDAIASATVAYAAKKKTKKKKEIEGGDEENEPVKKKAKKATSKAATKKEVEVVDLVEVSPEAPPSPAIHPYYL